MPGESVTDSRACLKRLGRDYERGEAWTAASPNKGGTAEKPRPLEGGASCYLETYMSLPSLAGKVRACPILDMGMGDMQGRPLGTVKDTIGRGEGRRPRIKENMSSYYPSLEEVRELSKQGNLIPLYQEINADLETPVSAYLKVAEGAHSFLLESVEGGEQLARYSFIGTEPYKVVKTGPGQPYGEVDPLTLIEEELDRHTLVSIRGLPRFHGGAVGFIAYDVVRYFEPVPPAGKRPAGAAGGGAPLRGHHCWCSTT